MARRGGPRLVHQLEEDALERHDGFCGSDLCARVPPTPQRTRARCDNEKTRTTVIDASRAMIIERLSAQPQPVTPGNWRKRLAVVRPHPRFRPGPSSNPERKPLTGSLSARGSRRHHSKGTSGKRPRRSKAAWLEFVQRWRRSGQTAGQYAQRHGLHVGTLAVWGTKLREELPAATKAVSEARRRGLPSRSRGGRAAAYRRAA